MTKRVFCLLPSPTITLTHVTTTVPPAIRLQVFYTTWEDGFAGDVNGGNVGVDILFDDNEHSIRARIHEAIMVNESVPAKDVVFIA